MPTPEESQTLENTKDIIGLKKDVEYIKINVDKIMNNHLVHIANDIKDVQTGVSALSTKNSENKPLQSILYKVVEYVILAVIGYGIIKALN
jgi:hypothetical protein